MHDFYLRIIKFEEGLDVADELRVGADQRLDDGHAGPGLLARPLGVGGPGPPVQPPLAENRKSVNTCSHFGKGREGYTQTQFHP